MRSGRVFFDSSPLNVQIVDNPREAAAGLADRLSIPDGYGMLYPAGVVGSKPVFFFNKNKVSLDLIWVKNQTVVATAQNISPGNTEQLQYKDPVDYTLETSAGFVASRHVNLGTHAMLL